ncbi:hypothetical protein O6H91_05G072400 [Diphasiastrum complanatum]|uniref:Uncharacterized protein n=1 Tax=Diphasiastrum complanatum TaxID=34168 RepID=A0ACC2DPI8_DIPCM|nr:hypothetical protein O6H91_05G072400 [Diphasiastrum complanatum]
MLVRQYYGDHYPTAQAEIQRCYPNVPHTTSVRSKQTKRLRGEREAATSRAAQQRKRTRRSRSLPLQVPAQKPERPATEVQLQVSQEKEDKDSEQEWRASAERRGTSNESGSDSGSDHPSGGGTATEVTSAMAQEKTVEQQSSGAETTAAFTVAPLGTVVSPTPPITTPAPT